MKINSKTRIVGGRVILVPYEEHHVVKYHQWMQSTELQQLTASEPLSLEQEYAMQRSWREDEDKCTFIILDKEKFENGIDTDAMIGDTNLFLKPDNKKMAEAEIMIAEPWARGQRRGREAMVLMMLYGITTLALECFQAKISLDNHKSIQMFTNLKFNEIEQNKIFNEITLEKVVENGWLQWLREQCFYGTEVYLE